MSAETVVAPKTQEQIFLPGVANNPQTGIYRDLMESSRSKNVEYGKIWELFAFQESFTLNLSRFTEGVIRTSASISTAVRELIAARTSYLNECRFCPKAHAAAAASLWESEELVWKVLTDLEASPIDERDKVMLRFTEKITLRLPLVTRVDVEVVRQAGWDDEAIYYAITTCALFNFYNRWITASGVPEMSAEAHRLQGQIIAQRGYIRDKK